MKRARGSSRRLVSAMGVAILGCLAQAPCSGVASAQTSERIERLRTTALPRGVVTLAAPEAPVQPVPARVPPIRRVPERAPTLTPTPDRAPAGELVRVPLTLSGGELASRSDVRILTENSARIVGDVARPVLELPREGRVVLSSEGARDVALHSRVAVGEKTPLPWLVLDTHVERGQSVLSASRPFLTLKQAIAWDAATKSHVATLLFGMQRESSSGAASAAVSEGDDTLVPPLLARFTVSCDEVTPDTTRIAQLGPAGYQVLHITCSARSTRTTREHSVQVHVASGKLSYPISIPKQAAPLTLLASATRVHGLGFGSTTLSVTRSELDGSAFPVDEDLPVQVLVRGGVLDESTLIIPRGQSSASLTVHPTHLGRLEVEAVAESEHSAPIALEVVFPWPPVFATLLGGVLGGYLSVLVGRRQRQRAARRVIEGVIVASIIVGAMLLLPMFTPLPAWARMSELGSFLVAALASFAGAPLLDRATSAMFPKLGGDEPAGAHR